MRLVRLSVDGVRNLADARFEAHQTLNVFVGQNGQGKTNLLEAIHLCAALRPLRTVERPTDLIGFGRERGVVQALFDLDGPLPVEVVCEAKGRRATLAGKSVRDVGDIAARIGVVSFVPEDVALVRGGPEGRRRALDRFAYGLLPGFAAVARRFDDALEQRNRALKEARIDWRVIDSFGAPFADAAAALMRARKQACDAWAPALREEAARIGGGDLDVTASYRSELDPSGTALEQRLLEALAAAREREERRRTTAVGPHHDDLVLAKDEHLARHLASQGEARALVLAMKLAAVRLFRAARGAAPLLLLDDVAGELDPARQRHLFDAVKRLGAQTFVTATHEGALPPALDAARFVVEGGRVRKLDGGG